MSAPLGAGDRRRRWWGPRNFRIGGLRKRTPSTQRRVNPLPYSFAEIRFGTFPQIPAETANPTITKKFYSKKFLLQYFLKSIYRVRQARKDVPYEEIPQTVPEAKTHRRAQSLPPPGRNLSGSGFPMPFAAPFRSMSLIISQSFAKAHRRTFGTAVVAFFCCHGCNLVI